MVTRFLTPMELDSLKNLKVIRADNELLQILLRSYYSMTLEISDLKNINKDYEFENEDLRKRFYETKDELHHTQKLYNEMETQNRALIKPLQYYLRDLERNGAIKLEKNQNGDVDAGF